MKVRRTSWRGRVLARALFFHAELADVPARAVAAWRPGTRLFALDGGVLVVFAGDTRMDAATAPGLVLVDVTGVLSAAPLTPQEREQQHIGSVVRCVGGRLRVARLDELPELSAAALVDTTAFHVLTVEPLGAPATVQAPPPRKEVDARDALLGATPAASVDQERTRVIRELAEGDAIPEPDGGIRRAQHRAARGVPSEGVGESLLRMVASALESVGLMDKVRAAHRKYVEDTLDLLKQGNIDDALRKAIPLSSAGSLGRPAPLSMPTLRTDFQIRTGPGGAASSSIELEGDLFTRLRNRYREAANKLERERRFKEAAFVTIELLGEVLEGIAVLERSGDTALMRLAAEIAEGKGLAPELVVRQWFLVGETKRAIAIARRHHAFAAAIATLERMGQRIQGAELRHEWARHLRRTGAFALAVDALRPLLPGATANVRSIVDEGIAARTADLPILVATRLVLDVAHEAGSPEDRALVGEIVDGDGPDGPHARAQLAQALGTARAPLRPLTSSLFRALCADVALGASSANLRGLVDALADPALRADLPPFPAPPLLRHPSQVVVLEGVPGVHAALDAVLFPHGRLLVALGEAGAVMLTRGGAVACRITEPCEQIVRSDTGASAILVARRGEVLRLGRFDVVKGRASHWIDVRARVVTRTYDGDMLFLGRGQDLLALDALADTATVLWQAGLEAPVAAVARDEQRVVAATSAPASRMFAFDARTLAPAGLSDLPPFDIDIPVAVSTVGFAVTLPHFAQPVVTAVTGTAPTLALVGDVFPSMPLLAEERLAAVCFEGEGTRAPHAGVVAHGPPGHPLVMHTTDGARVTALSGDVKKGEARLVVADDRGRAFLINVDSGAILARWAIPA